MEYCTPLARGGCATCQDYFGPIIRIPIPLIFDFMSPSEQSPLLNGEWRPRQSRSYYQKLVTLLKAEDEPSWLDSFRWFILGSWVNLLLLLVPVAAASHCLNWDAPLRFGFCFIAIVPLAKVRTSTPSP